MSDDLCQVKVCLASFFFNDPVENVLDGAKVDLALKQTLQVLVVTHHLQLMHVHVLRGLWMLVKLAVDFAKIPHVDATLMEEFSQALRVNRDALLLLKFINHIRNGFLIDVSCKLLDVVFLLFQLSFSHVQLSVLLKNVRVK